ncbi:MAG: hypothetical protein UF218_04945 [Eggerthellaceae bacterium]|nr:hypothetical protein [Eggerthellaceae bacterium]
MSGFKFVKQASDILSKMMPEKELEPSRLDLERLFIPIQSPTIAPYICDERMIFYTSDCFTTTDILLREALKEARTGSTVVLYAVQTSIESIICFLLHILLNEANSFLKTNTSLETDAFLGSKSIESAFFNAIPKLQKELSDLDFRIGETQLNSAFWPSIHHVQDELAVITKESIAKNTHCFISWIGDFDCKNSDHINKTTDELLMIESANLVNIIDQLTAFAKDSGRKITIGGFQGPATPVC